LFNRSLYFRDFFLNFLEKCVKLAVNTSEKCEKRLMFGDIYGNI